MNWVFGTKVLCYRGVCWRHQTTHHRTFTIRNGCQPICWKEISLFHWRFGPKLKSVCSVQCADGDHHHHFEIFGQPNGRAGAQKFIQYQFYVWIFDFVTSSCFNTRILIGNYIHERLVFGEYFLLLFFLFLFYFHF